MTKQGKQTPTARKRHSQQYKTEASALAERVGVVGTEFASAKLHFPSFAEDELILAATDRYPVGPKIILEKLDRPPLIVRERGSGTRKSIEALLTRQHHNLNQMNICATLGSNVSIKEAILANLEVSVISRHAVREELDSS